MARALRGAAMSDDGLNWQVEMAHLNSWPSPRQIILDGWLCRAGGGATRRANSAHPLNAQAGLDARTINAIEDFYDALVRPAMFRLPEMCAEADTVLAARGYVIDAPTRTLFTASLPPIDDVPAGLAIEPEPGTAWLAARHRLSPSVRNDPQADRAILNALLLPAAFVSARDDGRVVALGFGVLQQDMLIVESLMTDPRRRRQGFARRCMEGLFYWARVNGARSAALRVVADNGAALALYEGLGFTRDLYGYHYRVKS